MLQAGSRVGRFLRSRVSIDQMTARVLKDTVARLIKVAILIFRVIEIKVQHC